MNILLVDDDTDCRINLAEFLVIQGHNVIQCVNGHEALSILCAQKVDLVLTDIKMPKLSGLEFLKAATALPNGKIPIVLITGHGDMSSAIEALRAGASDYLLKPVNIKDILIIISKLEEELLNLTFSTNNSEDNLLHCLTERENEVLHWIARGKTNKEIAELLFLSQGTVRNYVSKILKKLNLNNRAMAIAYTVKSS